MLQGKTELAEVVSTVQVFRMERGRWPAHAAELLAFSRVWGEGLNLSGFHMLVLRKEEDWTLSVEYALMPTGENLASCGRLELRRVSRPSFDMDPVKIRELGKSFSQLNMNKEKWLTDQEATFQWLTRHEALPSKRIERSAYCFIG